MAIRTTDIGKHIDHMLGFAFGWIDQQVCWLEFGKEFIVDACLQIFADIVQLFIAETDHIALNQILTVTGDIDRRHAFQADPEQVRDFGGFNVGDFGTDAGSLEMLFQGRNQALLGITFGQGRGFARCWCTCSERILLFIVVRGIGTCAKPQTSSKCASHKNF